MARVAAGEGRHSGQDCARGIQRGPLVFRGIAEARPADDALARRDLHRHGAQPLGAQPRPPEQPILILRVAGPCGRVAEDQLRDGRHRRADALVEAQRLLAQRGDLGRQAQREGRSDMWDGECFWQSGMGAVGLCHVFLTQRRRGAKQRRQMYPAACSLA